MELLFWCPSEESQTVYKRPLIHQLIRRARFTVFAKIFVFFGISFGFAVLLVIFGQFLRSWRGL
jgi:hypothetical protein